MKLELTARPSADLVRVIRRGLSASNLARVPKLSELPGEDFLVVLYEDGDVVGGAACEMDWGWLYIDTLWVDENRRTKGYGKIIMEAAETYAAQQGVTNSYLYTTSFQARPFYEKMTYQLFGEIKDRPRGYSFYLMQKQNLQAAEIDPRIVIVSPPDEALHAVMEIGLLSHAAQVVPFISVELAVILRDDAGSIKGGVYGSSFWDWFDLRFLWVDNRLRGQGWGRKILQIAEAECRQRDCIGIICDTASFQALPFYQEQGFEIIGTLKDRPPGYESHFLQKLLKR